MKGKNVLKKVIAVFVVCDTTTQWHFPPTRLLPTLFPPR